MPMFNKPLSEYKRFIEALNNYNESLEYHIDYSTYNDELELFLEDANLDKLKALLGDDYYNDVYVPFKNKIASKVKVGEDEDGNPIMGENPDLKLKRTDYLLDTYSDNPQALKDLIANYKTKSGEIKDAKKGAKYLGENGEYKCYFVFTYPAAKYYGENTTWCITGRYKGEEKNGKYYFDKYIRDENLDGGYYFFLHKTNPRRKYALLQQVDKEDKEHPLKIHSVWSALNSPLTLDRLPIFPMVKEIPELKDVYKDVDIENSDHIKDRDRKSLEHDILISCQLPKENVKDAIRNLKEILEGDAYKDYKFDLNNIKDEYGRTPLYWACINNYTEVAKLLLEHGADVNFKDKNGKFPLYEACYNDNIELAKLLLEHGADVNSKNKYGRTPLYDVCSMDNIELVKLLLEYGADVNIKDEYRKTPLYNACYNNKLNIAKLLLEHGADVNIKDEYGHTPLYNACYKNNLNIAKLLLKHGADVNSKSDGLTPLYQASLKRNTNLAKLLIEHGADVNFKDEYGYTPLYNACYYNNIELIKLLLEHGAGKDLDADNLPEYITNNKEIEDLVLSYLSKNKRRNESIKIRKLYKR